MPARKKSEPRHRIDKRTSALADVEGNDDDLLTASETAHWLGVSHQWLELGRSKHYGPAFTRLSARMIRYRRGDVIAWLKSRSHKSTAEYAGGAQ